MTNKQQTRSKTTKTNCFGERMFRIGKQKRGRKSKEKLENYIDIATDKKLIIKSEDLIQTIETSNNCKNWHTWKSGSVKQIAGGIKVLRTIKKRYVRVILAPPPKANRIEQGEKQRCLEICTKTGVKPQKSTIHHIRQKSNQWQWQNNKTSKGR